MMLALLKILLSVIFLGFDWVLCSDIQKRVKQEKKTWDNRRIGKKERVKPVVLAFWRLVKFMSLRLAKAQQ